jgi:hypothetical protein
MQLQGRIVPNGIKGSALSLSNGEYLSINPAQLLSSNHGTVSFWVRPHWGDSAGSHAFLGFRWDDGRNGYFVISKGWWEPKGSPFTYLVFNNQDFMHLHKQVRFDPNEWTHIAAAWQSGKGGFLRLFFNGIKAAEGKHQTGATCKPLSEVCLGGDLCTPMAKGRWAEADFDEFHIYRRALSDDEVLDLYESQNPRGHIARKDAPGRAKEIRAIFDEGIGWTTASGALETIQRVKKAGFNVYVPCIWHGAGTRYPSQLAPAEKGQSFAGGDPLERIVRVAHDHGIEVHPWFTVALRQRDFFTEFHGAGSPDNAFDLQRPGFRKFIVSLMVDVARRYDVDGLNLDYIRTMGVCRCAYCRTEYGRRHGGDLAADIGAAGAHDPLPDPLQRWVDEAVESIVRDTAAQARSLKPEIVISVDGHPTPAGSREGRQEIRWANAGLVNVVYDMNYGVPPDFENHF